MPALSWLAKLTLKIWSKIEINKAPAGQSSAGFFIDILKYLVYNHEVTGRMVLPYLLVLSQQERCKMSKFEDKVKEVLDGLEGDDDFVEAVRDAIDYPEVVSEAFQDDATKKSIKELVITTIKDVLDDSDSSISENLCDAVREEIDISAATVEALKDETVKEAIKKAIIEVINADLEDSDTAISEALCDAVRDEIDVKEIVKDILEKDAKVKDALVEMVAKEIEELPENQNVEEAVWDSLKLEKELGALLKAGDERIKAAIAKMLAEVIENIRGENLGNDELEKIIEALEIQQRTKRLVADPVISQDIDKHLLESIERKIEVIGDDQAEEIAAAVTNSPTFKEAVESAVRAASAGGKLEDFARGVVERVLKENRRFSDTVLEQVGQALSARIADGIIKTAFSGR